LGLPGHEKEFGSAQAVAGKKENPTWPELCEARTHFFPRIPTKYVCPAMAIIDGNMPFYSAVCSRIEFIRIIP
jgi:hypothetical protein